VFGSPPSEVSIELVADRVGVGLGTIYRRFKNKEALVTELVRRLLVDVVEMAERHLDDPDGQGLFAYLGEIGDLLASHRGSVARMWSAPATAELVERSRDAQGRLLEQAQRQGLVRADLRREDIAVALWSIHGILDITRGLPIDAWSRHVQMIIAGWSNTSANLNARPLSDTEIIQVISHSPSPAKLSRGKDV
jgi:AcrR family transcriptional regulator